MFIKGTVTNYSNQLKLKLEKNNHGVIIISIDQCIKIAEAINENRTELNKVNADKLYKIKSDSKVKMSKQLNEKLSADISKSEATENNSNNDDLIDILKEQIKDLKQDKAELTYLLKQQQQLLHNQQSLQLQSNEKIKALELEMNEIKEDVNRNTTDVSVNAEDIQRDVRNNKVDNFYKDLREDRQNNNNKGFLNRLFKR